MPERRSYRLSYVDYSIRLRIKEILAGCELITSSRLNKGQGKVIRI